MKDNISDEYFLFINEAVRAFKVSVNRLKLMATEGKISVYVIIPNYLADQTLHKLAKVEQRDGYRIVWEDDKLLFNRLILLDKKGNECRTVESHFTTDDIENYVMFKEADLECRFDLADSSSNVGIHDRPHENKPSEGKIERISNAVEHMRLWVENDVKDEKLKSPPKYADQVLELPKFKDLNKRTLTKKAKSIFIDLKLEYQKKGGRPPSNTR